MTAERAATEPRRQHDAVPVIICAALFAQACVVFGFSVDWSDRKWPETAFARLPALYLPTQFFALFAWRFGRWAGALVTAAPLVAVLALSTTLSAFDIKRAFAVSVLAFGPAVMTSLAFLLIWRSRRARTVLLFATLPTATMWVLMTYLVWRDSKSPRGAPAAADMLSNVSGCCTIPLSAAPLIVCLLVRVSWMFPGPEPDEYDVELVETVDAIPFATVVPKDAPKEPRPNLPPDAAEVLRGADQTPLAQSGVLAAFTEAERSVVHRCAYAVVRGKFVGDDDFRTVAGVTRKAVAAVIDAQNPPAAFVEVARLAVPGVLNGLLLWHAWQEDAEAADRRLLDWTGATSAELRELLSKWPSPAPGAL